MSDYSEFDDLPFVLLAAYNVAVQSRKKKQKRRQYWVKPWLEKRIQHGAYHALVQELIECDVDSFNNFVRMDLHHFQSLLALVAPIIEKQDTNMRASISAAERLSVTLRFLATGDSYHSLHYLYRIGRSTLTTIIPETCRAIVAVLKDNYLKVPNTTANWRDVAAAFEEKWNFPHCIGAIDGKHIAIRAPSNSGSVFYNYKEFYSIILLAVVDAHCRFIWYQLGANGRQNDAGIYASSGIAHALNNTNNTLHIPSPSTVRNGGTEEIPYLLVGDEAFPLQTTLMKPYPHRGLTDREVILNYRLTRARRVSENAFGILVNRFRVLSHSMHLDETVATVVAESCLALHNFLKTELDHQYNSRQSRDVPVWRSQADDEQLYFTGNNSSVKARKIRDELRDFFWKEGQVPFQWEQLSC